MKYKIKIKPNTLKASRLFVSEDPAREVLNSVLIEKENVCATDGRRLIKTRHNLFIAPEDHKEMPPILLPAKEVDRLFANITGNARERRAKMASYLDAVYDCDTRTISMLDGAITLQAIEGKFPDYNQIMPKPGERVRFCGVLSWEYIRDAVKAYEIIKGTDLPGLQFYSTKVDGGLVPSSCDEEKERERNQAEMPALYEAEGLFMVIMPLCVR